MDLLEADAGALELVAVPALVNNVKNDGPELVTRSTVAIVRGDVKDSLMASRLSDLNFSSDFFTLQDLGL